MSIETFTQDQLESIRRMDYALTSIEQLHRLVPMEGAKAEIEEQITSANYYAFENYYEATRNIGPNREILVDEEMVKVASGRLLQRGIPQFIKHEPLAQFDKVSERIFGNQKNNQQP